MRCAVLIAAFLGWTANVEAAPPGIVGATHNGVTLTVPPTTPVGDDWRYGLGMPIQLDATTAGLLVNIRRNGTPYNDFEAGTDLIPFNSLGNIDAGGAVPISRSSYELNPWTGEPSITSKYPVLGGFVPRGAEFADGSPHPYGGTGFGVSEVGFYPADFEQPLPDQVGYHLELQQFSYNGSQFTTSQPVRYEHLYVGGAGWEISGAGLSAAIPDGNDLLYPVTCSNASYGNVTGVARFQYGADGWQPASFTPVSYGGFEPSMVRDVDGSLLFSNRYGTTTLPLWRSSDDGETWENLFMVEEGRENCPTVLCQALDGTPYFATNTVVGANRNILQIVPVNSDRDGVDLPITVRDGPTEFGASPSGLGWAVDHGVGNLVRLDDGAWHSVLAYRVLDVGEFHGGSATPYTGCYLEEVFSSGDPRPMEYRFAPEPSSLVLLVFVLMGLLIHAWRQRGVQ